MVSLFILNNSLVFPILNLHFQNMYYIHHNHKYFYHIALLVLIFHFFLWNFKTFSFSKDLNLLNFKQETVTLISKYINQSIFHVCFSTYPLYLKI